MARVKKRTKKDEVEELVRLQFEEQEEFLQTVKDRAIKDPKGIFVAIDHFISPSRDRLVEYPINRGRGRPSGAGGTISRLAFIIVNTEMRIYRARNKTKRVPKAALDMFIDKALSIWPDASVAMIVEYLRTRKRQPTLPDGYYDDI